jgi:hypothetical protein
MNSPQVEYVVDFAALGLTFPFGNIKILDVYPTSARDSFRNKTKHSQATLYGATRQPSCRKHGGFFFARQWHGPEHVVKSHPIAVMSRSSLSRLFE